MGMLFIPIGACAQLTQPYRREPRNTATLDILDSVESDVFKRCPESPQEGTDKSILRLMLSTPVKLPVRIL
jgi:hypothetical protein